jgi:DNA-binding FrmR family transcriptional regulator
MAGQPAKSGRYLYYGCTAKRKRGSCVCDAKLIQVEVQENFIIDRICIDIFNRENLERLARLTNKAIKQAVKERGSNLAALDRQLAAARKKLDRLAEIVLKEEFDPRFLRPKTDELLNEVRELESNKEALIQSTSMAAMGEIDTESVGAYVADLRDLLATGTASQRKSVIRSFIKQIDFDRKKLTIHYSLPAGRSRKVAKGEVLPFSPSGTSDRA